MEMYFLRENNGLLFDRYCDGIYRYAANAVYICTLAFLQSKPKNNTNAGTNG